MRDLSRPIEKFQEFIKVLSYLYVVLQLKWFCHSPLVVCPIFSVTAKCLSWTNKQRTPAQLFQQGNIASLGGREIKRRGGNMREDEEAEEVLGDLELCTE